MWWFIAGLLIGAIIGAFVMIWVFGGKIERLQSQLAAKRPPECGECGEHHATTIRGLEDLIHGLKSKNGKLAKEVQNSQFMRTGFRAR